MQRYTIHSENPHRRIIDKASESLRLGELLIYPTDTVYGIGCDVYNKKGIERLYRLKHKSKFAPISLVVADIQQASQFARISNFAYRLLRHCLPGPYTFILPATREIPKIMLSKRKEVGIRIPQNTICQALLESLGNPIVNTSVNPSPDTLLNDPEEIENFYQFGVDLFLDAGWLNEPRESTIVSLIRDDVEILREGKGEVDRLFE